MTLPPVCASALALSYDVCYLHRLTIVVLSSTSESYVEEEGWGNVVGDRRVIWREDVDMFSCQSFCGAGAWLAWCRLPPACLLLRACALLIMMLAW